MMKVILLAGIAATSVLLIPDLQAQQRHRSAFSGSEKSTGASRPSAPRSSGSSFQRPTTNFKSNSQKPFSRPSAPSRNDFKPDFGSKNSWSNHQDAFNRTKEARKLGDVTSVGTLNRPRSSSFLKPTAPSQSNRVEVSNRLSSHYSTLRSIGQSSSYIPNSSFAPKSSFSGSVSFGFGSGGSSYYGGIGYGKACYPKKCFSWYLPTYGWCGPKYYWYLGFPVYYPYGSSYYCDAYYPSTRIIEKEVVHHVYHVEGAAVPVGGEANDKAEELKQMTPAEQYEKLGDLFFRSGNYEQASIAYEKSLKENPEKPALHFILGDARFAMGDYHGAALAIRKGLEKQPLMAQTKLDKRSFYGKPEDFDKHLATLRQYIEVHPADADALLVLGYNLYFTGKEDEAVKVFQGVQEIDKQDFAAALFLAVKSDQENKIKIEPAK